MDMINVSLLLLVLGLAFFIAEALVVGFGVFGVIGAVLSLVSCVLTILYVPHGMYIVVCEMILVFIVLYILFQYISKHQLYGKIILTETLGMEKKDIGELEFFIGKEGLTLTPLRPMGTADFNGIKIDVFSDSGFIRANKKIKVSKVSDNKVYVVENSHQ